MPNLLNPDKILRYAALSFGAGLIILLSSCAQIPILSSESPTMAAKEVREAKAADAKAPKDKTLAEASSGQAAGVSRLFFDKEMLAMNERVNAISKRV
ncbi:MAG: hypothetical protein QGF20_11685, partial [Alphaproteobacteria bacterium]|nr:hypothetical protein [Alphaproteobacteria bacterium]